MKMQITSALLITLALFCFALPNTQAADGGVGNGNTAEGHGALESFTSGGFNTAIGKDALSRDTTGNGNTASGSQALKNNTTGDGNVADGDNALVGNSSGRFNTAAGHRAVTKTQSLARLRFVRSQPVVLVRLLAPMRLNTQA